MTATINQRQRGKSAVDLIQAFCALLRERKEIPPALVERLNRLMPDANTSIDRYNETVRRRDQMNDRPSVTRYVATYVNKHGKRTLVSAAQGRFTYATPEEAQAYIDAVTTNNGSQTIKEVWGENPRFEVRPCPCWPGHFDPQTIWFD